MTHINGTLNRRESVLKMSFKEKIYKGEVYSFIRKEPSLNHGGNGAVYEVDVEGLNKSVVAKFFEYTGEDEERRYERFKREIAFLAKFRDVEGIIDIIDKHCPEELSKNRGEAWYLMPKAKEYKVNYNTSIIQKLDDMIYLARIIEKLHSSGYAHRDIKPGNILLLKGKLLLADLGLMWHQNIERLTHSKDKLGPYKIFPPELESIDDGANVDYTYSDVYLFAKVLWMTLKKDTNGFRGKYDRGDDQIYLSKGAFRTFEPIHKLLEGATDDKISNRITITDCIKHLEYQRQIVVDPDSIDPLELQRLQYEENNKRMVAKNEPDEVIYSEERSLLNALQEISENIISNSVINIAETSNNLSRRIQVNNLSVDSNGVCRFEHFVNGTKVNVYLARVIRVICHKKDQTYTFELGKLDADVSEYISFGESLTGFNANAPKIYLSSIERVILSKPDSL